MMLSRATVFSDLVSEDQGSRSRLALVKVVSFASSLVCLIFKLSVGTLIKN